MTASAATGQLQILNRLGLLGTGSFTSTVGGTTLSLTASGSFPAIGCQFSGTGLASLAGP